MVGDIIGSNTIDIISCSFSGTMVYANRFSEYDIIGGIAGIIADGGTVKNCKFAGIIRGDVKDWESRSLQPYIGGVIGQLLTGNQTNNEVKGTLDFSNLNPGCNLVDIVSNSSF